MHNNGGSWVVVPLSRLTLLPPLNIYHSYSHKTRWRAFSQDGANDVDVAAQDEIFLLSSDGMKMKKKQQEKNDNKGKEISIESFQICLNISSRGRTLTPPNTSTAPLSPRKHYFHIVKNVGRVAVEQKNCIKMCKELKWKFIFSHV